jgi:hypothetical protein
MILSTKLYRLHNGDAVLVITRADKTLYLYLKMHRVQQQELKL